MPHKKTQKTMKTNMQSIINKINQINKTKPLAAALAVLAVLSSGCSINMKHGTLTAPAMARTGTVNVAAAATGTADRPKGANARAGWGRFTIFAIPVVPVYVEGDGNMAIAQQIQDALTQAGYTPKPIDATDPMAGKLLTCEVDKFRFSNYTWLFPIVPTWGSVELQLSLQGPDKRVLWTQHYRGSGSTLNFFDGYSSSCNSAMTSILNQMVMDFASDEFYRALNK